MKRKDGVMKFCRLVHIGMAFVYATQSLNIGDNE